MFPGFVTIPASPSMEGSPENTLAARIKVTGEYEKKSESHRNEKKPNSKRGEKEKDGGLIAY